MDNKVIMGVVAGAILLGSYYVEAQLEGDGSLPLEFTQGPEALDWLQGNESESALASNRFMETGNAVRFVRRLYDAGAERVAVPEGAIVTDEVETYADMLLVTLPDDPGRRESVMRVCEPELARVGISAAEFDGQNQVLLWWD